MQKLIDHNQQDHDRGQIDFPSDLKDPSNPGTIHRANNRFIKLSNSYFHIKLPKRLINNLIKIIENNDK